MSNSNLVSSIHESIDINAHEGVSNIVSGREFYDAVVDTTTDIINVLNDHCGPLSSYALLVADDNLVDYSQNVFTRDGIQILSRMNYKSPLQTYIKSLIRYVGQRIDMSAKDGTTTSMLFAAGILQHLMNPTTREKINALRLSPSEQRKRFVKLVQDLNTILDEKFVIRSDKDYVCPDGTLIPSERVFEAIVFSQALSSSGGDVEFASAMREVYQDCPKELWNKSAYHTPYLESDTKFSVHRNEFDYQVSRVSCETTSAFNHAFSTEYLDEDVTVLIYPDVLSAGGYALPAIMEYIRTFDPKKPLMVLAMGFPASLYGWVNEVNTEREKPTILVSHCQDQSLRSNRCWDLSILAAYAGSRLYYKFDAEGPVTDDFVFVAKKVHCQGSYLNFYGIVKDEVVNHLHPYFTDPNKFPQYTEVLNEIKTQIEMFSQGIIKDPIMEKHFNDALYKLISVRRPMLHIGGNMHDVTAHQAVAQDVVGAIAFSLTHGVTINGPISLLSAILECMQKYPKDSYADIILEAMRESIEHVIDEVYSDTTAHQSMIHDRDSYLNTFCRDGLGNPKKLSFADFVRKIINRDFTDLSDIEDYPVIQPITMSRELLSRMEELVVRICNTNKIVSPNKFNMSKK